MCTEWLIATHELSMFLLDISANVDHACNRHELRQKVWCTELRIRTNELSMFLCLDTSENVDRACNGNELRQQQVWWSCNEFHHTVRRRVVIFLAIFQPCSMICQVRTDLPLSDLEVGLGGEWSWWRRRCCWWDRRWRRVVLDLEGLEVRRRCCLSSSAPTYTACGTAGGLQGTDIVPGTAAGTATGIAGVVRDVIVSLAAGFARALGGQGFCYEWKVQWYQQGLEENGNRYHKQLGISHLRWRTLWYRAWHTQKGTQPSLCSKVNVLPIAKLGGLHFYYNLGPVHERSWAFTLVVKIQQRWRECARRREGRRKERDLKIQQRQLQNPRRICAYFRS